jgi:hypothetical protein
MGTRCLIGMRTSSGYDLVYCHYDGYPSFVGTILQKYYKKESKVRALINLGDMTSLGAFLGTKKTIDNDFHFIGVDIYGEPCQIRKYVKDYGRSSNKEEVIVTHVNTLYAVISQMHMQCCEYVYIYEGGAWFYTSNRNPYSENVEIPSWKKLTLPITKKRIKKNYKVTNKNSGKIYEHPNLDTILNLIRHDIQQTNETQTITIEKIWEVK